MKYIIHREDVNLGIQGHPMDIIRNSFDKTKEATVIVTTHDINWHIKDLSVKIHYTKQELIDLNIMDMIGFVTEENIKEYESH